MTEPELPDLDRAGRAAARGLRLHVERQVDPEVGLARIPLDAPRNRGGRILVAAVITLLVLGGLALAGLGDGQVRIDEDRRHPTPPPMALTPLGPTDGKESQSLPVEVEPHSALRDQQAVQARGTGFAPGESVGIVQCTREAGSVESGGVAAGIEACNIGHYTAVSADAQGVVTGRYVVDRFLTTSLTGTVDCASEPGRCLVAVGAISDYDRSGGFGIDFAAGEPGDGPEIPTLTVSPATGLTDGSMVRVRGRGYQPGTLVSLQVCSSNPMGCWSTGEVIQDQGAIGLAADQDGRIDGEVPVWQFLPATEPGQYVDCAVSACTLRIQPSGQTAVPAPVPLTFASGHAAPEGPSFTIDPNLGLAAGDAVDLTGGGFVKGMHLMAVFCVDAGPFDPALPAGANGSCASVGDDLEADGDGTVRGRFTIPDPAQLDAGCEGCIQVATTTTACAGDGCQAAATTTPGSTSSSPRAWCDGVTSHCSISLESQYGEPEVRPPFFAPIPVEIRLGRR